MASKKQKDEVHEANRRVEQLSSQADHDLGVMATANKEILNGADSIMAQIETSFRGRKIDISAIPPVPDGAGSDWAEKWLTTKGYDTSRMTLEDLLSTEEIAAIEIEINRPLVERLRWDRWDYIITFSAAAMGSVADLLWGDPRKGLSKYLSNNKKLVGGWMEEIHSLHHSGSPMDYQGFKMGGPDHRVRSIGHDLFGFLQGIWQIKNGTFTGGYYDHGKWKAIVSSVNQYGTPYEKMNWTEAIWHYVVHVFCDFFSSKSLPVPGFAYLSRMPVRDIRKLAHDMYGNGYNLRHMFVQAISVGVVELILRTYNHLKYYQMEVDEESLLLKSREMRLMAHSIVTAINVGKVAISRDPLLLNLPQILFTVYQFWPLIISHYRRNNEVQILLRNLDELSDESAIKYLDSFSLPLSDGQFGKFLVEKPILL